GPDRDPAPAEDGLPPHLDRLAPRRAVHGAGARPRGLRARLALDRLLEPGAAHGHARVAALLPPAPRGGAGPRARGGAARLAPGPREAARALPRSPARRGRDRPVGGWLPRALGVVVPAPRRPGAGRPRDPRARQPGRGLGGPRARCRPARGVVVGRQRRVRV